MDADPKTNSSAANAEPASGSGSKRPPESTAEQEQNAAKKPATAAVTSSSTKQLQEQIQQQLQQQLQAQLQAAAAKGQQASITPEQIQRQAQAMVQAAAQAQAVVAAAKARGDGLVPMNSSQIAALSQIQARAIVHARKSQGSPEEIQTMISLQANALIHAHTQAQIQAGIYKGEVKEGEASSGGTAPASNATTNLNPPVTPASTATSTATTQSSVQIAVPTDLTPAHKQQIEDMKKIQEAEKQEKTKAGATTEELQALAQKHVKQLADLERSLQRQNSSSVQAATANLLDETAPQISSSSPQFLAQLNSSLNQFWQQALEQIKGLQNQTEQDFKNHNDLPLARIKRIMKSDEDVRMISAEAPVLFAKACELFILDLSVRSWNYSQLHKRRTLQKEDVKEAIQKTDIFDFLVDVIQ